MPPNPDPFHTPAKSSLKTLVELNQNLESYWLRVICRLGIAARR
jgi:hypothetical protein